MGLQSLPAAVKVLLVTQMLFNIGFYLVVPFIAVQMTDSLGAGGHSWDSCLASERSVSKASFS